MKVLLVLNGPPYGDEKGYNALRLAHALAKADAAADIVVFLMADAVSGAKAGQKTPDGYYNFERMLKRVLTGKGRVSRCHIRDASWFQWPLLEAAIEGNIVADFALCNKSFNCSCSGHDL